jgi:cysteine desulfuration protein SufE
MNFKTRTQQIETEFGKFDDWNDKYSYLIELGRTLPVIDEKYKRPQYLIEGCQSRVWLYADFRDGKVYYTADSDAIISKGIASLIIRSFNELTPDEILAADLTAFDRIGLKEHLSLTRSNGMIAMIKQIQLYAMAFKIKGK